MTRRNHNRGFRSHRMPGVAALQAVSESQFTAVPEHLYIGSCLQEGRWSPASDGLTVDYFFTGKQMYRFLNNYVSESGGSTPPLSLFLNLFPGLQYVDDVSRKWAASQLHHKFEKQRWRVGLREIVEDVENDDFDDARAAVGDLMRHSHNDLLDGVSLDEIEPGQQTTMIPPLYDSIARCGGIRVQDYVLVAARTSVGKSYRLMQHAVECVKAGFTSKYFSLEMSRDYCAERLWTLIIGPDWVNMDNQEIMRKIGQFHEECGARLRIFDQKDDIFTPFSIRRRMRHGEVAFIDHVGKMKTREGRRMGEDHSHASGNSQDLKDMAEQDGVTVFAGIQANRAVGDQMPNDMFLQYSDSYGQDADIGIGLLRKTKDVPVTINQIFKHRHGSLEEGRWFTNFDPKHGNFEVVAPEEALSVLMEYQNSDLA